MKKVLIIPLFAFLLCCKSERVKKVVIGKDMSFDKYGSTTHTLYYEDGYRSVTGSTYYSTKVGDTILVSELHIN